jgi:hypothetical protein
MTNPDQEPKSGVTGTPEPRSADGAGIPTSADAVPALSAADQSAPVEDYLLAAVTALSSEAIANIDSTLDQLTSATDLFDVPAFDLDA